MRIPFPERLPLHGVVIFAALLFLIQSIEGTPLYFSGGCVAFLLIATLAFNAAGGLTRASGVYVFFYSLLVVVVGLLYKAMLLESAESNLRDPRTTIAVYVGGITAMYAAVMVSRRFTRKQGLLQNILKDSEMYRSCVGCIVFGYAGVYLIHAVDTNSSAINKAFSQLNELLPLGIIIGVMYEIRRSGGTRSINAIVAVTEIYYFVLFGLLGFSKQGLLTGFYCWVLPVCAMRYRLTVLQVISCLIGIFIIFQYLVPYAQYGRRFLYDEPDTSARIDIAVRLLKNPELTRERFEESQKVASQGAHYFDKDQGFWDRLTFIHVDDSLIDATDKGRVFGYSPILASFLNVLPHFILPDKPVLNYGNVYAHEVGGLPEDDTTTGISWSPTAEAYHMGKWFGVLVVAPIIWCGIFIVFDTLLGDLRVTPWGLLAMALLSHTAPEGALTGAIYLVTYGTVILVFCAVFATWIAPTFAMAVLGRDRRKAQRQPSYGPALAPRIPN